MSEKIYFFEAVRLEIFIGKAKNAGEDNRGRLLLKEVQTARRKSREGRTTLGSSALSSEGKWFSWRDL